MTVPPYLWLYGEEAAREREEAEQEEAKVDENGNPVESEVAERKLISEKITISMTLNN